MRANGGASPDGFISLKFHDRAQPLRIHIDGCNSKVCIGKAPVGPVLRARIAKSAKPKILYATRDGGVITVYAPLHGLSAALSAIN